MAYVEVTGPEMEAFLKRGFRALRPKQGTQNRELYYDLTLSPTVFIRVWTSIRPWGSSAGVGEDAIRVQLMGSKVNRPLVSGKAPIVKRTNSWRDSLQDKIEDYLETYEEQKEYFDERGGAEPGSKGPPASIKQVKFIMSMASRATEEQWGETGLSWPADEGEVKELESKQASRIIEILLGQGLGNKRYSSRTLDELGVRAIIRDQIMKSSGKASCEGSCGGDCSCDNPKCKFQETGVCTCGKEMHSNVSAEQLANQLSNDLSGKQDWHDSVVVAQEARQGGSVVDKEANLIASILEDLSK